MIVPLLTQAFGDLNAEVRIDGTGLRCEIGACVLSVGNHDSVCFSSPQREQRMTVTSLPFFTSKREAVTTSHL